MSETTETDTAIDPSDEILARYRRKQRITIVVIVTSLVLIVAAAIGFALLVNANRPETGGTVVQTYDAYREAWESAMAKASVEATFPAEPIALQDLRATGMHEFSATFTGEELSALLTMHPFEYEVGDSSVSLQSPSVSFPAEDTGSFDGRLSYAGSRYRARAEGPVRYAGGSIEIDADASELSVEGFGVGGDRRDQALRMVARYLNALLAAAPQLTVDSARIVEGGVEVSGMAPDAIEFDADSSAE